MKALNIHFLEHVPFETPGYIEEWAVTNNHQVSRTRLYLNEPLPDINSIDFLVIMGGPMGVYDEMQYQWMVNEKIFIKKAIDQNKKVLGICLGSQLIADVLDAKVYPNKHKEIGFYPIHLTPEKNILFNDFPQSATVFHWHGDTFDLPENAVHIAFSDACKNQAFVYKQNVVALQFHLEVTEQIITGLLLHGGNEIVEAPYIQTQNAILSGVKNLQTCNNLLNSLLTKFTEGNQHYFISI